MKRKNENKLLAGRSIHEGELILVNARYPVMAANPAGKVISLKDSGVSMERRAASVLLYIMKSIGGEGAIEPVSGYRTEGEQRQIYKDSEADRGEVFTRKYVALPNHSEHQTGLAIDLGLSRENIDFICPDFPYEGICQRFREEAAKYGYIQRYKEEKEEITGISHEPWHFRYVGYPHSEIMEKKGMCLEEYIQYVRQFAFDRDHIHVEMGGQGFEIFYVKENQAESVSLPEKEIYKVSGNNVDGFIVTLWKSAREESLYRDISIPS